MPIKTYVSKSENIGGWVPGHINSQTAAPQSILGLVGGGAVQLHKKTTFQKSYCLRWDFGMEGSKWCQCNKDPLVIVYSTGRRVIIGHWLSGFAIISHKGLTFWWHTSKTSTHHFFQSLSHQWYWTHVHKHLSRSVASVTPSLSKRERETM